jgi:hypothetical protein
MALEYTPVTFRKTIFRWAGASGGNVAETMLASVIMAEAALGEGGLQTRGVKPL